MGFSYNHQNISLIMEKNISEQPQLNKIPTKRKTSIKKLPKKEVDTIEGLIDAIEAIGLEEFMEYIRSPWKMLWPNFVAGIARGFWALVGATIVIALIWWTLSIMIDLPLIGKQLEPYIEKVQTEFKKYTEATNYKENFSNMEQRLTEIREELKKQNMKK